MECARASFTESGLAVVRLRTWVNVQMPCPGEGYDAGYPHIHANTAGTTMVHYLDPGDVPAPLDIFDGEEVIETIYPEAGKTVYIPNGIKHGVRKNQGDLPRVAFIATAYSM